MAEKGRNKPRKVKKKQKRKSPSIKQRFKKAGENIRQELDARNKDVVDVPLDEMSDLFTSVPTGLYRMGKGNLKMLAGAAKGLAGYAEGGEIRAFKNGGAVMKGRGPKFKGSR